MTRPADRRRLAAVCGALLAGAAALEGAARLPWFTAGVDAVGRGTVRVTARGADLVPSLTAVALLALAAVAAAVAVGGPARRVLGVLVAAAGAWVAVAAGGLLLAPPAPGALAALPGAPAGGTAAVDPVALGPGPLPALLGALLLVAAGITLAVADARLPRLGARYTRAAERPPAGHGAAADGAAAHEGARQEADPDQADPDRAAWDALDAGGDPTADPTADPTGPARPIRTDGGGSGRAD